MYLVLAHRWCDPDNHTYVVGLYKKKQAALDARLLVIEARAGKYGCDVIEIEPATKASLDHTPEPRAYVIDCLESSVNDFRQPVLTESERQRLMVLEVGG